MLLYLTSINLSILLLNPAFKSVRQTKVNNPSDPESFELSLQQMAVLTNLTLNDDYVLPEGEAIENYIGGVYMQEIYNSTEQQYNRLYYLPQDCADVFPHLHEHPTLKKAMKGYQCPPVSMSLLGQHGDGDESKTFMYIVNSC